MKPIWPKSPIGELADASLWRFEGVGQRASWSFSYFSFFFFLLIQKKKTKKRRSAPEASPVAGVEEDAPGVEHSVLNHERLLHLALHHLLPETRKTGAVRAKARSVGRSVGRSENALPRGWSARVRTRCERV